MDRKPKILYIVKHFSAGIFTYLVQLSSRLIDEFDIVIGYSVTPDTPADFRSYFDSRVELIRVVNFENELNVFSESAVRNEMKQLVNTYKPDIIHLHGYNAGRIGRKALDGMGIPMFYTPHGYLYLAEDHNLLTRSVSRSNERSAALADCTTIACSKGEFAETLAFTQRAVYINNGIDIKALDEIVKDEKPTEHPLTVFTTGLVNYQKRPELFNEIAMAMPDVRFVWIGNGGQRYKLTAPNVEVTGWLTHDEAIKRVYHSDVFILTSLWEGLPISLLEAMYLGKLCIVSNVIGNRDVITNGENGYVCDTAAAFVNAINQYKHDNLSTIIENAHNDIIDNYTLDQMVERYAEVYRKAVADRK
ncbi:MAG: glycosyltransferase family 4 protein [Lachnospiraceae bacterium]|nr:glycosyltransferase family 4 protein [Lachnospiraceae bacterium]